MHHLTSSFFCAEFLGNYCMLGMQLDPKCADGRPKKQKEVELPPRNHLTLRETQQVN